MLAGRGTTSSHQRRRPPVIRAELTVDLSPGDANLETSSVVVVLTRFRQFPRTDPGPWKSVVRVELVVGFDRGRRVLVHPFSCISEVGRDGDDG